MTASVRFSLAGARRTTGVKWPGTPGACANPVTMPRPAARVGTDRRQRLAEHEPLPDRERLRPAIRVDAGGRQSRRDAAGIERQLPGQDVVEHLAPLAERGLDEPPQLVFLGRIEAVVRGERLDDDHRRLDGRLRLERRRRHGERDPDAGVVLDEHREVAHPTRRRRDPLGDLALDHEDETLGPRRLTEQPVQDRARDVVRQVGHDVVGRLDEVDEVLVERIAFDESQGIDAVEPLAEERRQTAVELDGRDRGAGVEETAGQETEARADLEDPPARRGSASARIASSTSASARKFCDRRGGRAVRLREASHEPSPARPGAPPSGSPSRERQRRTGVEVEPGPRRRRRTGERRPLRSSPRCRCRERAAGR